MNFEELVIQKIGERLFIKVWETEPKSTDPDLFMIYKHRIEAWNCNFKLIEVFDAHEFEIKALICDFYKVDKGFENPVETYDKSILLGFKITDLLKLTGRLQVNDFLDLDSGKISKKNILKPIQ